MIHKLFIFNGMKYKVILISTFTFLIPLLTPYGLWVFSYADPFLILRDLVVDSMGTRNLLTRIWRFLIIGIALVIVYFVLKKDKLAIISAVTSLISETLDFLLTLKFISLKHRPFITVISRIFDTTLFMSLAVAFKGLDQLDYNIFIDTFIMCISYFILFYSTRKTALFQNFDSPQIKKGNEKALVFK